MPRVKPKPTSRRVTKPPAVRPLDARVLIRADAPARETPGGILLPDQVRDRPTRGVVVAAGPGRLLPSGDRYPVQVAVGQTVLFSKFSGAALEQRDLGDPAAGEYFMLAEEDVLAILD